MTENHTVQGLICSVMSSDLPFLHDYGQDRREEEEAYAPSTASMCVKMSSCKDKVGRILTDARLQCWDGALQAQEGEGLPLFTEPRISALSCHVSLHIETLQFSEKRKIIRFALYRVAATTVARTAPLQKIGNGYLGIQLSLQNQKTVISLRLFTSRSSASQRASAVGCIVKARLVTLSQVNLT